MIQSDCYRNIIDESNVISFKADKTLSREYNMPFGMCIDFTGGKTSATPPIQCFSLKGKDYMPSSLDGPNQISWAA